MALTLVANSSVFGDWGFRVRRFAEVRVAGSSPVVRSNESAGQERFRCSEELRVNG